MPTEHEWELAGYRIEQYKGDAANVVGRARLPAEGSAALEREIARCPEPPPLRQARGPLMQQRMAKARRDLLNRMGHIA